MRSQQLLMVILIMGWSTGQSQAGRSFQEVVHVDGLYYTMSLYQDNAESMYTRHFVDMGGSQVHDFLSNHTQAAELIEPGFHFPFYGHLVESFFVTTHGFLSFAPGLHNLMYKTQYIAPLRVKLDPARFQDSTVNYVLTEDSLTVQWTNVTVAEPFEHASGGRFTFQVTLRLDGTIAFVYVRVPDLLSTDALYDNEPVAGISDAFLVGDSELHVYHTLNVDNVDIRTGTVVVFHPRPTCITQTSCEDCSSMAHSSPFRCHWCPLVQRCSDGADRLREHWDQNGCGLLNVSKVDQCDFAGGSGRVGGGPAAGHTEWRKSMLLDNRAGAGAGDGQGGQGGPPPAATTIVSAVVSVVLVLALLALLAAFAYVYGKTGRDPFGLAGRFATRLEANYKRFGGARSEDEDGTNDDNGGHVELGRHHHRHGHQLADKGADINMNMATANDREKGPL